MEVEALKTDLQDDMIGLSYILDEEALRKYAIVTNNKDAESEDLT